MTEANDIYRYDTFISYSHHDKEWVQGWLLPRLEKAGLRVCIDFRDFEPGLPSLVNMENAVERSRKTLIVLTPAWMESEWTTFESLLIQTGDPAGRRARMIPLRLKSCNPPKRIAMLTYVDFTQPSEFEFQLQRLVLAIRGEPMLDAPRPVPEPRVVSNEAQELSMYDDQHLRTRRESLEKELAETVADMAKVEKQYRATTSVIERNRLDLELEALREHRDRLQQEYDNVCQMLGERPAGTKEAETLIR